MVEIERRKAALIAELEVSRGEIRGAFRGCHTGLNPANILRRTVKRHAAFWLLGAVLGGSLLSRFLSAPRRETSAATGGETASKASKTGLPPLGKALLGVAWDFARPLLMEWLTQRLTQFQQDYHHPAGPTQTPRP